MKIKKTISITKEGDQLCHVFMRLYKEAGEKQPGQVEPQAASTDISGAGMSEPMLNVTLTNRAGMWYGSIRPGDHGDQNHGN